MRAISRQALNKENKSLPRARSSGQLLVEAMIAISVTIVGLLGIFSLLSRSLGLYKTVADQYVAANLAAEGIEVVKNILDSNAISGSAWNKGLAASQKFAFGVQYNSEAIDQSLSEKNLRFDSTSQLYNYETGTPTNFKRVITIENISPDEIQVNSEVIWKTRGGLADSKIDLEDHFFNWR